MALNLPLALKVWDQITQHPETHDQRGFFHDGVGCIAGWGWHMSNGKMGQLAPTDNVLERYRYHDIVMDMSNESAKAQFRIWIDEELAKKTAEVEVAANEKVSVDA